MTTGERIYNSRKRAGMTQEELAERLGVSRQAVSKWEQDAAYPETEKLVELCRLFGLSADELLLGGEEEGGAEGGGKRDVSESGTEGVGAEGGGKGREGLRMLRYEYVSQTRLFGMPLVHVNLGMGICRAKGVFAIGNVATGLVAIGPVSAGIVSLGAFSVGILALGAFILGLLSLGAFAVGVFALGGVAVGVYALGGVAIGYLSFGGAAVGHFAVGDWVYGFVAIGRSHAAGENAFLTSELPALRTWLDANLSESVADRLWSLAQLLQP